MISVTYVCTYVRMYVCNTNHCSSSHSMVLMQIHRRQQVKGCWVMQTGCSYASGTHRLKAFRQLQTF